MIQQFLKETWTWSLNPEKSYPEIHSFLWVKVFSNPNTGKVHRISIRGTKKEIILTGSRALMVSRMMLRDEDKWLTLCDKLFKKVN